MEYALTPEWTIFAEYNYMDFGRHRDVLLVFGNTPVDIDQRIQVVKFGLNYRFGPSAVVARY